MVVISCHCEVAESLSPTSRQSLDTTGEGVENKPSQVALKLGNLPHAQDPALIRSRGPLPLGNGQEARCHPGPSATISQSLHARKEGRFAEY